MKIARIFVWLVLLLIPLVTACRKGEGPAVGAKKLQVVTTLFPLYDFARQIGGDRVEVTLLLPPGVEPHDFEPRPEDVVRLARADLFVYTNQYMEPWAARILKGVDNKGLVVIDASVGAAFIPVAQEEEGDEGGHSHEGGMNPHIWLSIPNAERMVENIRDGLIRKDPAGSASYQKNAEACRARLAELDKKFREGLSRCSQRLFLHGGHYAFGYLAKQYGLRYVSAYPLSANAEPTPRKLMALVDLMRKNSLNTIFYEELLSPRVAETIARETGATLLKLNVVENVTREELAAGATYLSLMEENLKNLRTGLQCR
ncbi:MAG TPA: metal ABC transporter substrate-binding protein [Geobacteraceae bacterium]|nr:metal ABC transporter substrate-binding protein [Geobacteraceae bacterium]